MKLGVRYFAAFFVLLLGAFTLYCASVAQGPDFEIHFEREVRSESTAFTLTRALEATSNWPNWFFSMKEAQVVDLNGRPYASKDQVVATGSLIRLFMEPPNKQWKRFELTAQVLEYVPQRRLRILVTGDSNHKLTELFSRLEWEVDLDPEERGSIVRGKAFAHTRNWRARVFGTLTPRILMNQVFYPNVIGLAGIRQPLGTNPLLQTDQ